MVSINSTSEEVVGGSNYAPAAANLKFPLIRLPKKLLGNLERLCVALGLSVSINSTSEEVVGGCDRECPEGPWLVSINSTSEEVVGPKRGIDVSEVLAFPLIRLPKKLLGDH